MADPVARWRSLGNGHLWRRLPHRLFGTVRAGPRKLIFYCPRGYKKKKSKSVINSRRPTSSLLGTDSAALFSSLERCVRTSVKRGVICESWTELCARPDSAHTYTHIRFAVADVSVGPKTLHYTCCNISGRTSPHSSPLTKSGLKLPLCCWIEGV